MAKKGKMISEIERIVEEACARETNIFGYGIWTHHITLVAQNAKRLARLFNADPEIVEIAALLHDYASIKSYQALVLVSEGSVQNRLCWFPDRAKRGRRRHY